MGDNQLSKEELAEIREAFDEFDLDGNGHITSKELGNVMKTLGEYIPGYELRIIEEADVNKNGKIEFSEFLEIYKKKSKKFSASSEFKKLIKKIENLESSGGTSRSSTEGTKHSNTEAERVAFVDWINTKLQDDAEVKPYLPIDRESTKDLFDKIKDGIILCKMINLSVSDTVDERAINKPKSGKDLKVTFKIENLTLALNSASSIGCNIVNIGPDDLVKGTPHLVLGLLWQIIKIGLFANITLTNVPGLAQMAGEDESLNDLMALSPEEILLRWFNYHLAEAGYHGQVNNFSDDIKDSEYYSQLLPKICPKEKLVDIRPMQEKDLTKRAEKMLQLADTMDCRKFVQPKDVVDGNSKLNMAFVANLFSHYPAFPDSKEEDKTEEQLEEAREAGEETREEKTFRNWMNSIGVTEMPYVNHLYPDLCNGIVLLHLFDIVKPGVVNWDKVNHPPFKQMGGKIKQVENCNYAVEVGKGMKFSLVGIGGHDIHDRNETLILAVLWQQMRAYTLDLLSKLSSDSDSKKIEDKDIVEWVNEKLKAGKKTSSIKSFKDPCISTSRPILDLVDAIRPGTVKYDLVYDDDATEEEKHQNAKYALSVARKIGATTYALPDDLVEVNNKMVLTVFACLMAAAKKEKKE